MSNDEIEILKDNTEEIKEILIRLKYGYALNGNPEYENTNEEIVDKINELVRTVNQLTIKLANTVK